MASPERMQAPSLPLKVCPPATPAPCQRPLLQYFETDSISPGAVESLYQETKPLGLRTLLMEPGRFRTNLLSQDKVHINRSSIDDYRQASDAHSQGLQQQDMRQPGDPKKFVEIVIDLVRQEGCAAGRVVPFRLPVGTDAIEEIRDKLESTTRVIEDWGSVILGTGYTEST